MALKNKYVVFAVLGLAVASVAAWWFLTPARSARAGAPAPQGNAAAKPGAQSPAKPVMVEATKVRQMTMRDDAEAVGSLRSRRSVVLRPEISGRITQLNFSDGQRVRKGQLLVQLDDQLPRAQVQQSRAELSIARGFQWLLSAMKRPLRRFLSLLFRLRLTAAFPPHGDVRATAQCFRTAFG